MVQTLVLVLGACFAISRAQVVPGQTLPSPIQPGLNPGINQPGFGANRPGFGANRPGFGVNQPGFGNGVPGQSLNPTNTQFNNPGLRNPNQQFPFSNPNIPIIHFTSSYPKNPFTARSGGGFGNRHCVRYERCWPTFRQIATLRRVLHHLRLPDLRGHFPKKLLEMYNTADSLEYNRLIMLKNLEETRRPAFIVRPQYLFEVQHAVLFAREFNLPLSILSSGHDYVGRSTGNNSVLIDMRLMQKIVINRQSSVSNTGASVDVESGNNWFRVYGKVSRAGYVMSGASAHTVAVGGWTLGGGHSPLVRKLGLGVDNVVSFTLVTADGRIVKAAHNGSTIIDLRGRMWLFRDNDLFWALRGGGGGSFGVITNIVFKLHRPPPQGMVTLTCQFPLYSDFIEIGRSFMEHYLRLKATMPPEWSGYIVTNSYRAPQISDRSRNITGQIILTLMHYGSWLQARPFLTQIAAFGNMRIGRSLASEFGRCQAQNRTSFWSYESKLPRERIANTRIVNAFFPRTALTLRNIDSLIRYHSPFWSQGINRNYVMKCTWTHLGGKVTEVPVGQTAVSEHFRKAQFSVTCGNIWSNALFRDQAIRAISSVGRFMHRIGQGSYINEPERSIQNWKQRYWGNQYQRLERIKKKWDPDNFLTCYPCVGADLPRRLFTNRGLFTKRAAGVVPTISCLALAFSVVVSMLVQL